MHCKKNKNCLRPFQEANRSNQKMPKKKANEQKAKKILCIAKKNKNCLRPFQEANRSNQFIPKRKANKQNPKNSMH